MCLPILHVLACKQTHISSGRHLVQRYQVAAGNTSAFTGCTCNCSAKKESDVADLLVFMVLHTL